MGVTSGWAPRLRKGYGTIGGFLVGQETGMFHDSDADPELVDFGGGGASIGRARAPQVKYTWQGPYGAVFAAGFENPVPRMWTQFGQVDIDTVSVPTIAPCSVTGNTAANLPATTACAPSTAFFNALKSGWPELIGTARINQPWGHFQIGGFVRTDQLNDGQFLDQKFVGYGGAISGDVHPFSGTPGALGKDDLGFGFGAATEPGGQFANGAGVVTNFGRNLNVPGFGFVNPLTNAQWNTPGSPTRRAYDRVVRAQSPTAANGWIWYQHWWTENLRSTLEVSGITTSINTGLVGQNTTNNKQLATAHANLIWSPVAFVDLGVEYGWGHRVTVANFKGDAQEIEGTMRVRF
jgi:DcaP outer membrane protein